MSELSPEVIAAIQNTWPFLLMIVIFYFLLYRPQKKEQKKRASLLDNLKKGDRIVTAGGIYGTIVSFNEKTINLKVADKVEITISRTAVGQYQNEQKNK